MDLWTTILQSSSKPVSVIEKNILVLGDSGSGKSHVVARLVGENAESVVKGVGLDFRFSDVKDASGDCVGRLCVWRLQGDAETHGPLLLQLSDPSLVLVCVDLSRPSSVLASLSRWTQLARARNPQIGVVVVGCKSDIGAQSAAGDGRSEVLLHALRKWSVEKQPAGVMYVSAVKGNNCALLRAYVEHAVSIKPLADLEKSVETVERDNIFIPIGWDSQEKIDVGGPPPDVPLDGASQDKPLHQKKREEELVQAEAEQAFLLRHMKVLESLREEEEANKVATASKRGALVDTEVIDTPSTPVSSAATSTTTTTTTTTAPSAAAASINPTVLSFTTPIKTPSKPQFTSASPATPAAPLEGIDDHNQLASFFSSLLSKEKSPYKK